MLNSCIWFAYFVEKNTEPRNFAIFAAQSKITCMQSKILLRNKKHSELVENLLAELSAYSNEQLNHKASNGGWSALQNVHHLILAEEGSLRYVQKKMNAAAETLPKAGLGAAWRAFVIRFYLGLPFKFKAPKGVGTEYLPEQSTFEEAAAHWRNVRAQWQAFFEQLPAAYVSRTVYRHPLGGRLSWDGMIDFFDAHARRHRNQIQKCLRNPL